MLVINLLYLKHKEIHILIINEFSAYTGLPTIAGWWVHEWLWRGSSDVVGIIIPDIVNIYESDDIQLTKN